MAGSNDSPGNYSKENYDTKFLVKDISSPWYKKSISPVKMYKHLLTFCTKVTIYPCITAISHWLFPNLLLQDYHQNK